MTSNLTPAATVHVTDPAELIAAVPVLLGFRPRDSLVLIALHRSPTGRHRLGLGLRGDLPEPRHTGATVARVADALLLDAPAEAIVLVVGEGPSGRPAGRARSRARRRRGAGPPRRDVAQAAVAALRARGIAAHSVMWAARCAGGAPWACYDGCCAGTLHDPRGTAAAAQAVAQGQVVYAERAELEALVVPVTRSVLRRREKLLERAIAAADRAREVGGGAAAEGAGDDGGAGRSAAGSGAADRPGPPSVGEVQAGLQRLDAAVEAALRGRLRLDDATVVALAVDLGLPQVRDTAMRLCVGPRAAAAEQLWAALARETPDPEAAVPAALLALSALVRGRGALANVALDRAEAAWPAHHLTGLLREAVGAGMRPEEVRAWLQS